MSRVSAGNTITLNITLTTPNGCLYPVITIIVAAGAIETWRDVFEAIRRDVPSFSYLDVPVRCWAIPDLLLKNSCIMTVAMSSYVPVVLLRAHH
jgi:hypothetical protein